MLEALMSREGCEPKAADSTAKEAPDESTVPVCGRAASSTVRSKRPRDVDVETALREACESLGRPDLYKAPSWQEDKDLADGKNRRRGENARKNRRDICWAAVENVRTAAQRPSAEMAASIDRAAERDPPDGCAAGHSNLLDQDAPLALNPDQRRSNRAVVRLTDGFRCAAGPRAR